MKRIRHPQESLPEKPWRYDPLNGYEDWVRPLRAHWPTLFPPRPQAGEPNGVKAPKNGHGGHRRGG